MLMRLKIAKFVKLQIIDMATTDDSKRSLQKINDERSMDNSGKTHNMKSKACKYH